MQENSLNSRNETIISLLLVINILCIYYIYSTWVKRGFPLGLRGGLRLLFHLELLELLFILVLHSFSNGLARVLTGNKHELLIY